jgi:hypothetical protein
MKVVEVRGCVSRDEITRQQEEGAEFVALGGNYHELRRAGESVRLYFWPDRHVFTLLPAQSF